MKGEREGHGEAVAKAEAEAGPPRPAGAATSPFRGVNVALTPSGGRGGRERDAAAVRRAPVRPRPGLPRLSARRGTMLPRPDKPPGRRRGGWCPPSTADNQRTVETREAEKAARGLERRGGGVSREAKKTKSNSIGVV